MPRTYNELYITLRQQLKQQGVEACSLEARLLTAAAAGKTPEELLRDLQLYTSPEVEARLEALSRRRLAGEPAAYLLGTWDFHGLELKITPDVLIPRSDTETLVDAALALLRGREEEARILDLCTGSGCVGCALGTALPKSHIVLADKSGAALEVARENARTHLGVRGVCMQLDVLVPPEPMLGSFDVIVCNPPYVARGELAGLDASVRDYEPREALDGGEDGLDFYRVILKDWAKLLRQSGWLLFEVGETQAEDVEKLMRLAGLRSLGRTKDSGGWDRVVYGRL